MIAGEGLHPALVSVGPDPTRTASVAKARVVASAASGEAARARPQLQRLDRHLKNAGMRSAAHRDYAVGLGRKQIAQDRAAAEVGGDLDDFLKFCPGAGRIESLSPPVRPATANKRSIAQDGSAVWVWRFNPLTNCLEQVRSDQV
jgi:hypothetical protein